MLLEVLTERTELPHQLLVVVRGVSRSLIVIEQCGDTVVALQLSIMVRHHHADGIAHRSTVHRSDRLLMTHGLIEIKV